MFGLYVTLFMHLSSGHTWPDKHFIATYPTYAECVAASKKYFADMQPPRAAVACRKI